MNQIMESVLCVEYTEEPRIRNIIQQAIDTGEVPSYNAFVKESKQKMNARKRRAQAEAKEAEMCRKELGLDEGVDNLKALIQVNLPGFCHFFMVWLLLLIVSLESMYDTVFF